MLCSGPADCLGGRGTLEKEVWHTLVHSPTLSPPTLSQEVWQTVLGEQFAALGGTPTVELQGGTHQMDAESFHGFLSRLHTAINDVIPALEWWNLA